MGEAQVNSNSSSLYLTSIPGIPQETSVQAKTEDASTDEKIKQCRQDFSYQKADYPSLKNKLFKHLNHSNLGDKRNIDETGKPVGHNITSARFEQDLEDVINIIQNLRMANGNRNLTQKAL